MTSYSVLSITFYLTLAPIIFFDKMNHTEITSIKQLANYLRCNEEFLSRAINNEFTVIDSKSTLPQNLDENKHQVKIEVVKLYIQKKGKASGFRVVHAINTFQLANTLKILNTYLNGLFSPENSVHGFVSGKSIKSNAFLHISKKIILSVDIENYFESITKEMVTIALTGIGFDKTVAEWISCITTIDGHLVQGFNTSPTIANLVTHQMDKEFAKLCGDEIVYSRYADDIYFSSNGTLPNLTDIENVISQFGFKLNESKTKEMKRGQRQYVTGLTVFDNKYPRIPKRIKRNLRLELHFIKELGFTKHAIRRLENSGLNIYDINDFQYEIQQEIEEIRYRVSGWIYFIYSIEPNVGRNLFSKLNDAKD